MCVPLTPVVDGDRTNEDTRVEEVQLGLRSNSYVDIQGVSRSQNSTAHSAGVSTDHKELTGLCVCARARLCVYVYMCMCVRVITAVTTWNQLKRFVLPAHACGSAFVVPPSCGPAGEDLDEDNDV